MSETQSVTEAPSAKTSKPMWLVFCYPLFLIIFFGHRALEERDVATRQDTGSGLVGLCEEHGKSRDNYCDYTFQVGEYQYTGVGKAKTKLDFGQRTTVYYDSENPYSSALEDFSEQSHQNLLWVCIGAAMTAVMAVLIWLRRPDQRNSPDKLPSTKVPTPER